MVTAIFLPILHGLLHSPPLRRGGDRTVWTTGLRGCTMMASKRMWKAKSLNSRRKDTCTGHCMVIGAPSRTVSTQGAPSRVTTSARSIFCELLMCWWNSRQRSTTRLTFPNTLPWRPRRVPFTTNTFSMQTQTRTVTVTPFLSSSLLQRPIWSLPPLYRKLLQT
eukprot:PhF_6_TR36292/c0_g1_i1/m.52938